jgi:twitching motility protein PilT
VKTIDRVVNVFPPGQQNQIRLQLAGTLQGVISQILIPKIGGGRIAAFEILVATDAVRAAIRENKVAQLPSIIQTGKQYGMIMLEDHLNLLISSKKVMYEEALSKANAHIAVKQP